MHTVGICASDVHYWTDGKIGSFVVEAPMILGHEGSGTVTEVGEGVTHLSPGDRVAMEPGVPNPASRAVREGNYNVDPEVQFWATPPVHGCLTEEVVHPAAYTYKLPDSLSFAEGALIEPFAVGMYAATKAGIAPGDVAAVVGSGTIGIMTAIAARAGGASRIYISDVQPEKLGLLEGMEASSRSTPRRRTSATACAPKPAAGAFRSSSKPPVPPLPTRISGASRPRADASSWSGCRSSRSPSTSPPRRAAASRSRPSSATRTSTRRPSTSRRPMPWTWAASSRRPSPSTTPSAPSSGSSRDGRRM